MREAAMALPFTADQFFAVFRAYNTATAPVVVLLWGASAAGVIAYLRHRDVDLFVNVLLAVQWLWAGAVYHAVFFTRINPAAWLFAALFALQAAVFVWLLFAHGALQVSHAHGVRRGVASALAVYAIAYPFLVALEGHTYPATPTFGVPCPTAILTVAFLIAAGDSVPALVAAIPLAWCVVGGTASFLLNVRTDLMLLVSAALLAATLALRINFDPVHHERHA